MTTTTNEPKSQPRRREQSAVFPRIRTIGIERRLFEDAYHSILVRPWWQFVMLSAGAFLAINAVFSVLYLLEPGCITNVPPGSLEDSFYFSVQSLATIGYGGMAPATRYGHSVVTVEAFVGILFSAVMTGVTFSKFARPTARVMFSARIAAPRRFGVPHLMFRMANRRLNTVVEAQLNALILIVETTPEGETVRRPVELSLVRSRTALFTLSWTAMHAIDEKSPFFGPDAMERLRAQQSEIFLSFTGVDETLAQAIHARHRYRLDDIAWDCRFADVLSVDPDGTRTIDYSHFDEVLPVAAADPITA